MHSKTIKKAVHIILKNKVLFATILLSIVLELVGRRVVPDAPYMNSWSILQVVVMIVPLYLLVFPKAKHYKNFQNVITWGMLVLTAAVVVHFLLNPILTDIYAYEDGPVENITAMAFFVASAVTGVSALISLKNRVFRVGILTLMIACVFFFLGGEEISWGQRILNIPTPSWFIGRNRQGEMNIHNLSQDVVVDGKRERRGVEVPLYILFDISSFIFFTAIPFYRPGLLKILNKLNLSDLTELLPNAWLIVPFSMISGFSVDKQTLYEAKIIWTVLILISLIKVSLSRKSWKQITPPSLALIILLVSIPIFRVLPYRTNVRFWFPTEYSELFVGLGMLVYALDLMYKQHKKLRT